MTPGRQAWVGRLLRFLHVLETTACVVCFIAVTMAILSDVIGRELVGKSIFGSQRLAVLANAIVGLIGFSIVVGTGGHLRPTAFDKLVPPAWSPAMDRLADVVSALLCIGLGWFAVMFVRDTYKFGETMMSLPLPLWPLQVALPYAFFSAALRYLLFAAYPRYRPRESQPGT